MTDSDGYNPWNRPQRLEYLSDPGPSDSEMDTREDTPLFPKQNSPAPPYSPASHTNYGTPVNMGDQYFGAAPPLPPHCGRGNGLHVCTEGCGCRPQGGPPPFAWWGQGWRRPEVMGGPWIGVNKTRRDYSVSSITKWLFVRISFVVLAYFLLRNVLNFNGYGRLGGFPRRKGPGPLHCPLGHGDYFEEQKKYTLSNSPSFEFQQKSFHRSGSWPHGHFQVSGSVQVNGVEDAENIVVDFVLKMNDEGLKDRISISVSDQGIVLETDLTPHDDKYSCIEVLATVSVPLSKPEYVDFVVRTESMDIILDPSVDLKVEKLSLSTMSGDVTVREAYGIDSHKTVIIIGSGDITGDFGLFDLVRLETKSGSITASVIPQDSNTRIAEYVASTISGSIKTSFPKDSGHLPKGRTYRSKIETTSGSIKGDYLLGEFLLLKTISGSIHQVSVTATSDERSTLTTDSQQGSTNLVFPKSLGNTNKGLTAKHTTISGSINVKYPGDWEGVVTGKSMSGSVTVRGEGVTIVENTGWPVGHFVKGIKGAGNDGGKLECSSMSGSVNIQIGPRN